jgi:hypothetical protein
MSSGWGTSNTPIVISDDEDERPLDRATRPAYKTAPASGAAFPLDFDMASPGPSPTRAAASFEEGYPTAADQTYRRRSVDRKRSPQKKRSLASRLQGE